MDMILTPINCALALLIAYFMPEFLALYRRWQGAQGTSAKVLKVTTLALFLAGTFHTVSPYGLWDFRVWIAVNVLQTATICLWFVTAHPNGGGNGADAVDRYGPAGWGYPIAYALWEQIPPVKILGWHLAKRYGWTEVGELWLGYVTGRVVGLLYLLAAIAKGLTACPG